MCNVGVDCKAIEIFNRVVTELYLKRLVHGIVHGIA